MDEQEQRARTKEWLLGYGRNRLKLQQLKRKIRKITQDIKLLPYIGGFNYGSVHRGSSGQRSSPVERYEARKGKLEERRAALEKQTRDLVLQITESEKLFAMLPGGDLLRDFYGSTTMTVGEVGKKYGISGLACAIQIATLERVELPRLLFKAGQLPGR